MKRNATKSMLAACLALCLFLGMMPGMRADAAEFGYKIMVNRAANCVTVYEKTADGGEIPIRAFVCSVGRTGHETPLGSFKTSDSYPWGYMIDGSWGRYSVRIYKGILFHSVPYYSNNPADMEWEQYNKLGEPASLGCVRLTYADVKWIYENCPRGTEVVVYDDADNPGPLGKPEAMKLLADYPMKQWDPTNTEDGNPWNELRPQLYQKDGGTDGVIRVPAGEPHDYIYNVIGLEEHNGYQCRLGEYNLTMYGNYDLDTPGIYEVSVIGFGPVGVRCEYNMKLLVEGTR